MQLHILPRAGYPSRDAAHRLTTEIGGLQSFDEKGGADPELGETMEQETEAVLLPVNLSQNDGLGDRGQFRIVEITTDAEFGIDGDAYLGGFPCSHVLDGISIAGLRQSIWDIWAYNRGT
jgi:hypothetical protein